jgi:hypothetical protein
MQPITDLDIVLRLRKHKDLPALAHIFLLLDAGTTLTFYSLSVNGGKKV